MKKVISFCNEEDIGTFMFLKEMATTTTTTATTLTLAKKKMGK